MGKKSRAAQAAAAIVVAAAWRLRLRQNDSFDPPESQRENLT
jgi:hypothetical protein